LRFSAYRSNVDDMITLQYLGQLYLVPRFQYANVEHARLEGWEVAGQFQFGGTQVGVAIGLPRGTDLATGEKLLDAGTGRATFDLSVPIGRVLPHGRFAARLQMSDALTGVDSSFARPSFATVALEASTIFYSTRAVFAVRNLFDASYREPLSFIPEPGRTFAVSLRRDFDFALGH
jgi:outer membrane receptor protein involved in Fe transport